jgi:hypothetical protein
MRLRTFIGTFLPCAAVALAFWSRDIHDAQKPVIVRPITAPERARVRLKEAFSGADLATQKSLEQVLISFERKDYEGAAVGLLAFCKTPHWTFEQWQVFNGIYMGLQWDIVSASRSGDPEAAKAAEILRQLDCCRR